MFPFAAKSTIVLTFAVVVYSALAQKERQYLRYMPAMAAAVMLCAAAVRLSFYLRGNVFYVDESLLRMAVYGWNPRAPLEPLQFFQTAAPLFVAVSRAILSVWRADEYGARLVPLTASVLLLPVLYYGVAMLWSRGAALAAILLAGSHFPLCLYGAFFKQYEIDALVTATIIVFAGYYRRHRAGSKVYAFLALGGILALLISQTAFIGLFILLLFLAAERIFPAVAWQNKEAPGERANVFAWIFTCAAVWAAVTFAAYLLLYAPLARAASMQAFWSDSYLSLFGKGAATEWRNAADSLLWSGLPGGIRIQAVALLLGVLTAVRRRDFPLLLLIFGPIAATVALAILHIYPVAPRLWLFLLPSVITGASIGAATVWQVIHTYLSQRTAAVTVAACLALMLVIWGRPQSYMAVAAANTLRALSASRTQAEMARSAVSSILQDGNCDAVYIASRGMPSWFFYSSQFSPDTPIRFAKLRYLLRFDSPTFMGASPEAVRLPDSGEQFDLQLGCRREIYGLASGTPGKNRWQQDRRQAPIPGWAHNEVDRLTRHSEGGFWLYLSDAGSFEVDPILDEVKRRGYTVTRRRRIEQPVETGLSGGLLICYASKSG
jgi:hypothetical protein